MQKKKLDSTPLCPRSPAAPFALDISVVFLRQKSAKAQTFKSASKQGTTQENSPDEAHFLAPFSAEHETTLRRNNTPKKQSIRVFSPSENFDCGPFGTIFTC